MFIEIKRQTLFLSLVLMVLSPFDALVRLLTKSGRVRLHLHGARVTCPPLTNIWADQHTLLFERTHTWLSIHSTDRPGLAHIPQDDAQQLGELIGAKLVTYESAWDGSVVDK